MSWRYSVACFLCLVGIGSLVGVSQHIARWEGTESEALMALNREVGRHSNVIANLIRVPPLADLQACSVRVDVGSGRGSGVLVTRQVGDVTRTYVWTAGHVVVHLRDSEGEFRPAVIYREVRDRGKYLRSETAPARVIAYSDADAGDDLALLEVLKDNYCPLSVSASFTLDNTALPVGTELIHVGCTMGLYNSVSRGIISQTDRDILGTGKMFDQTSCIGYPGSSGGGVYLARDGKCVGLLVRGVGPGLNFIVPTRRMVVWAKRMQVEWAIDANAKLPTKLVRVEDNPLDDGSGPPADTDAPEPLPPGGPQTLSLSPR